MIPFKMSGIDCSFPQSYSEMTLGQFLSIRSCNGTDLAIISILSGIKESDWLLCENVNIDLFAKEYLEFLKEPFEPDYFLLPDYITISGKQYTRPKGVGVSTYGQKLALTTAIVDAEAKGGNEIDCYAFALALYMQPTITGTPYDADEVDKLVPDIMNCKLGEAFPICSFFLLNFERLLKESQTNYLMILAQKKYKLESKVFENLASSQSFSIWRRFSIRLLRMFYSRIMPRYTLSFLMKLRQESIRKS